MSQPKCLLKKVQQQEDKEVKSRFNTKRTPQLKVADNCNQFKLNCLFDLPNNTHGYEKFYNLENLVQKNINTSRTSNSYK